MCIISIYKFVYIPIVYILIEKNLVVEGEKLK